MVAVTMSIALPHSPEALILCVLRQGPNYGQGIVAVMSALMPSFRLAPGTLYPRIRSLKRQGLIAFNTMPADVTVATAASGRHGGRPRRFYRLTAKGQREAAELAEVFRALGREVRS